MKSLLLLTFFLLHTFDKPGRTLGDDYTFQVCELKGRSKDLKKLFFLLNSKNKIDISKLTMFYEPKLKLLTFHSSEKMIGYYNLSYNGEIIIDNFNPLRSKVSFRDLRERKYVLNIQFNKGKSEATLVVNNSQHPLNKINKAIVVRVCGIEDGFKNDIYKITKELSK